MDKTTLIFAASALITPQDEIKSPLKKLNDVFVQMAQIHQALPTQPFYNQLTSYQEWNKLSIEALTLCNTIKLQKLSSEEKKQFHTLQKNLQKQTDEIKKVGRIL